MLNTLQSTGQLPRLPIIHLKMSILHRWRKSELQKFINTHLSTNSTHFSSVYLLFANSILYILVSGNKFTMFPSFQSTSNFQTCQYNLSKSSVFDSSLFLIIGGGVMARPKHMQPLVHAKHILSALHTLTH